MDKHLFEWERYVSDWINRHQICRTNACSSQDENFRYSRYLEKLSFWVAKHEISYTKPITGTAVTSNYWMIIHWMSRSFSASVPSIVGGVLSTLWCILYPKYITIPENNKYQINQSGCAYTSLNPSWRVKLYHPVYGLQSFLIKISCVHTVPLNSKFTRERIAYFYIQQYGNQYSTSVHLKILCPP